MLTHRFALLALVASAGLAGFACQDATEKLDQEKAQLMPDQQKTAGQGQAQVPGGTGDQQVADEKSDYKDRIQKEIGTQDKNLDDVQKNASGQSGQAKTNADMLIGDVNAKRTVLQTDMQQIDGSGVAQWSTLKTKIDGDLDAFTKSLRTASREIKATPARAHGGSTNPSAGNNPTPSQP